MKLQGAEFLSRYSHASARSLLVLSAATIAIEAFGWNSTAWNFLDRELKPNEFRVLATFVLGYLSVSTAVYFIADYSFYTKWYAINQVAKDSMDSVGSVESTQPAIEGLVARLRRLEGALKSDTEVVASFPSYFDAAKIGWRKSEFLRLQTEIEGVKGHLDKTSQDVKLALRSIDEVLRLLPQLGKNFTSIHFISLIVLVVFHFVIPVGGALIAFYCLWS